MKNKKLSEKEKDESKIDSFLHPIDSSLTHLASKIERMCFPSLKAREILGEEKEGENDDGVVRFYLYTFSLSLRTFHVAFLFSLSL